MVASLSGQKLTLFFIIRMISYISGFEPHQLKTKYIQTGFLSSLVWETQLNVFPAYDLASFSNPHACPSSRNYQIWIPEGRAADTVMPDHISFQIFSVLYPVQWLLKLIVNDYFCFLAPKYGVS